MVENSKSLPSAGSLLRKFEVSAIALLSCLALAGSQCAYGQSEQGISAKLNFVAWGDSIEGLSLKSGETGKAFTAASFAYSDTISYKGPQIVEIFQNAGAGADEGETYTLDDGTKVKPAPKSRAEKARNPGASDSKSPNADPPAAKTGLALELEKRRKQNPSMVSLARIPNGCTRATVLLAPAPDGTYQSYVINDDPSKLPLGKLRIHNLSPYAIAVVVPPEKKPYQIKRNQQVTLPASSGQIIYELAYLLDNEWTYQENNIVKVRPNEQTQMLILRSDNQFFVSSGGSTGGFLQNVVLRRTP